MKKHFHHREWIANFMRDFGRKQSDGGEFFTLPELFFYIHDPFIKARFF